MKRFSSTAALVMALFSIAFATVGCGKSNTSSGSGSTTTSSGLPGYVNGVAPLPGGGLAVAFSGARIYESGVRLWGITTGFGLAPTSIPSYAGADDGAAASLSRRRRHRPRPGRNARRHVGLRFALRPAVRDHGLDDHHRAPQVSPLGASVTGSINLSPQAVQSCYQALVAPVPGSGDRSDARRDPRLRRLGVHLRLENQFKIASAFG